LYIFPIFTLINAQQSAYDLLNNPKKKVKIYLFIDLIIIFAIKILKPIMIVALTTSFRGMVL